MYQAGTLSGNPVAMAAGLATLRAADDAVYAALDANADRLSGLLADTLTEAGVPHQVPRAGNMLSVFFADAPVTDFASARATQTWRFPPFFHALLDAGVYPPLQRLRGVVRLGRARRRRVRRASPPRCPAAARAAAAATDRGPDVSEQTTVHVMRHGEVHNPEKILYGRLPGYHLSERGRAQAQAVADWLAHNDIVYVVAPRRWSGPRRPRRRSPPHTGLPIDTDARPHRVGERLRGQACLTRRRGVARSPELAAPAQPAAPRRGANRTRRSPPA